MYNMYYDIIFTQCICSTILCYAIEIFFMSFTSINVNANKRNQSFIVCECIHCAFLLLINSFCLVTAYWCQLAGFLSVIIRMEFSNLFENITFWLKPPKKHTNASFAVTSQLFFNSVHLNCISVCVCLYVCFCFKVVVFFATYQWHNIIIVTNVDAAIDH